MHVLFLSHYFPPEVNAPASRTFEHARQWAREPGVQVTVLTNHPNHPHGVLYPGFRNAWFRRETVEGIPPAILSDRLKLLERERIIQRRQYTDRH